MTTLDTIALVIGYIFIYLAAVTVFVIMPILYIGKYNAEQNKNVYRNEMIKRYGIDPHSQDN